MDWVERERVGGFAVDVSLDESFQAEPPGVVDA